MSEDPLWRRELDGFARRHEADEYAHASMRHDLRNDILGVILTNEKRIKDLEFWQQRIIGALAMLGAIVTVAAGAGVVELLRR